MIIYGVPAPLPFLKGHVRHVRPVWLLEEIGAPYDLRLLEGEAAERELLELNPFGKVPALQDGSLKLFESGAICAYLAEKHERLIPPPRTPARALHDQWMYAAVTMIEPHTVRVFAADHFYDGDPDGPILRAAALETLEANLAVVEAHLSKQDYLLGAEFSVCDIMMTSALRLLGHTDVLLGYPRLAAYVTRNSARPAHIRAAALQ